MEGSAPGKIQLDEVTDTGRLTIAQTIANHLMLLHSASSLEQSRDDAACSNIT